MINEFHKQYLLYVQSILTEESLEYSGIIKYISDFINQESLDKETQYTINVNEVFEFYSKSIPSLISYESFLRDKKLSQII